MRRRKGHRSLRAIEDEFMVGQYMEGRFATIGNRHVLLVASASDLDKVKQLASPFATGLVDAIEVDGVPHAGVWCSSRFERAILSCGRARMAYSMLLRKLTGNGIKQWFPELWLKNHNVGAARIRRRDEAKTSGRDPVMSGFHDTDSVRGAAVAYGKGAV